MFNARQLAKPPRTPVAADDEYYFIRTTKNLSNQPAPARQSHIKVSLAAKHREHAGDPVDRQWLFFN
jgi:hypothetical protein